MNKKSQKANDIIKKVTNSSSAKEGLNKISDLLNSDNPADVAEGRAYASDITKSLIPLLFDQTLYSLPEFDKQNNFIQKFYWKSVKSGNGTQEIRQLITGAKNTTQPLNKDTFVPTKQSTNMVELFQINFFTQNSNPNNPTFAPEAFCFEKEQTIPYTEYMEVFKEGKPEMFFANLRNAIYKSFVLFMYDKLGSMITDLSNYGPKNKITGSGNNAFECWSQDLNTLMQEYVSLNSKFNFDNNSNYIHNGNDYMIICSRKTYTTLKSSLLSQLFNSAKMDINQYFSNDKFFIFDNKINYGDESTPILVDDTQYIDDNTIIIASNKLIKWISQFQGTAEQSFASNFTNYYHHYIVMAAKFDPWEKIVVYTNPKLNTQPTNDNMTQN